MTARKPKLIILNGPPGCGKDTIARLFVKQLMHTELRFKGELVRVALLIARISEVTWNERYNNRALKEAPWDLLGGLTQRQYLIKVSEEWIKPVFGKGYFGKALANEAAALGRDVVVSDGGFIEEVGAVIAGTDHEIHVVRLHRQGFTYEGDSRSYVYNSGAIEHDVALVGGEPDLAVLEIVALCGI